MTDSTKDPLPDLIPVDIKSFRIVPKELQFDVFIKLSETNKAHIFSKSTGIDYKRLAQYIQKGIKELYISSSDLPLFKSHMTRSNHSIINDPNTTQDKKISALINMTDQNLAEIFSQFQLLDETLESTQKVIQNYVDLMLQSPLTLAILLKLASQGEYLYYHSIAVSIFSMFIAKASGQLNHRMLEIVGMGGFLHDIGCSQLPAEVICNPTELQTPNQRKEMHSHSKLGLKMVEKVKDIPDEVRFIIYQHHEEPGGGGYPNALRGPVIYYPAKMVAIADSFSALITNRPHQPAFSVEKAIKKMELDVGKYDRELVKILRSVFLTNSK